MCLYSDFHVRKMMKRRRKWINFIHRQDWTPSKTSAICIKHFQEGYIVSKKPGKLALTRDAIPTRQSTSVPKYLNSTENVIRNDPEERRLQIEEQIRQNDLIGDNFNDFKANVNSRINLLSWYVELSNFWVTFYQFTLHCGAKNTKVH